VKNDFQFIPDFPGYFVNRLGEVLSTRRGVRFKKPTISRTGYERVSLQIGGSKDKHKHVHALVLEAFVGPCPEGHEIRHKNGNPVDNRLENLSYGTPLENAADKQAHGTTSRGEDRPLAKLTEADVVAIRADPRPLKVIAEEYGTTKSNISQIRNRKRWKHV